MVIRHKTMNTGKPAPVEPVKKEKPFKKTKNKEVQEEKVAKTAVEEDILASFLNE